MRVAVCDDMEFYRDSVRSCIKNYCIYGNISVDEFEDGQDLLCEFEAGKYDIIFLDFYMQRLNGIPTAEEIRKIDQKVIIIFVTSEDEVPLWKVDALMQISKLKLQEKFNSAMSECERVLKNDSSYLYIYNNGRKLILKEDNILYIQDGKEIGTKTFVVKSDEKVILDSPKGFWESKTGILIKINGIREIGRGYIVMKNGKRVKVGLRESYKIKKLHNDSMQRFGK